ncbi:MAG: low affinity iron permease family protein [Brevundimonas sp.]|uniref:low affinity iron permease family protein n=1 Tax=Brevundimonas sp. TaxID=1871086 RepID=UPI0025C415C6|nr:low affinity iron permease family protein [Brevundimonas sp.]MBX3476276.1 low affinity iron permease family protein [Brevundimonas sp.]
MERLFIRFANQTAKVAGKPWTFVACLVIVLVWAVSGPIFGFNETWQLIINTGTTIITFLMVFLIQNTQNRDAAAMHAKLDELVYATTKAENRFVGIEHLTDRELDAILEEVEKRAIAIHAERRARMKSEAGRGKAVSRAQPAKASPARGKTASTGKKARR